MTQPQALPPLPNNQRPQTPAVPGGQELISSQAQTDPAGDSSVNQHILLLK